MKKVLFVMGSENDFDKCAPGFAILKKYGIPFEVKVASAHRSPARAAAIAQAARSEGFGVIIAAAGAANHLGGAMAANSTLPVIGLPLEVGGLGGLDALLSTSQMPGGVPIAAVGINGAKNAALIAASILSITDEALARTLEAERSTMAQGVEAADARVQEKLAAL